MTSTKEVSDALGGNNTLLTITENTDYILITPLDYIDRTIFSEIGRIMHGFNATFIRGDKKAGVTTHWQILKIGANSKLAGETNHLQQANEQMQLAQDYMQKLVEAIEKALEHFKEAGYQ